MSTRTINLAIDADTQNQIVEVTGGTAPFYQALGYLSTWSMSIPHVEITCSVLGTSVSAHDVELVAVYRKALDLGPAYVIGAIWQADEQRFSFHS